jgi:hypothetical protein
MGRMCTIQPQARLIRHGDVNVSTLRGSSATGGGLNVELIEMTQKRVAVRVHGDFASSKVGVRVTLAALAPLCLPYFVGDMIALPRVVAFAKVLAANGVVGGIIGVGLRELVSDFAAGVGRERGRSGLILARVAHYESRHFGNMSTTTSSRENQCEGDDLAFIRLIQAAVDIASL